MIVTLVDLMSRVHDLQDPRTTMRPNVPAMIGSNVESSLSLPHWVSAMDDHMDINIARMLWVQETPSSLEQRFQITGLNGYLVASGTLPGDPWPEYASFSSTAEAPYGHFWVRSPRRRFASMGLLHFQITAGILEPGRPRMDAPGDLSRADFGDWLRYFDTIGDATRQMVAMFSHRRYWDLLQENPITPETMQIQGGYDGLRQMMTVSPSALRLATLNIWRSDSTAVGQLLDRRLRLFLAGGH